MPNYTFHTLSPADFEELVRDLLQAELGIRLEDFKSGRDGGIDLRYARSRQAPAIVQCKHYGGSKFADLRRHLEREERPKIVRLNPERYVLCTSLGLSPANKKQLLTVLSPHCHDASDIFGRDDLNNLLGRHPDVESAHFKLWLTSTPVLLRVLQSGVLVQSELEVEAIKQRLSLFVRTPALEDARKKLQKFGFCVISGPPGIGKTTLAEILLIDLLEKDHEVVVVREDIREAFVPLQAGRKRIVYYDDFLGRASLAEGLAKNEEQNIARLLGSLTRGTSVRAVLTTREYILADAIQRYPRLDECGLDLAKCIVDLRSYGRRERARILYNHLYVRKIRAHIVEGMCRSGIHRVIVDHKNYSPRIVDWMTRVLGGTADDATEYAREFCANLDNPTRVWDHAFRNDLSAEARQMLLCMASLPSRTGLECLETAWRSTVLPRQDLPGEARLQFSRSLRQLSGTFLRNSRHELTDMVEFHDPSVRDFVHAYVAGEGSLVDELLSEAVFFEQIGALLSLGPDGRRAERPVRPPAAPGSVLARAVSLIDAENPGLEVHRKVGGQTEYRRAGVSFSGRLCEMSRWSSVIGQTLVESAVLDQASRLLRQGAFARDGVDDLGRFLKVVCAFSEGRVERDCVVRAVVSMIDGMFRDDRPPHEWQAWGSLVMSGALGVAVDVGSWQMRASEYCKNEGEVIRDNAETEADMLAWSEELEDVADAWKVDVTGLVERLRQAAVDLPREGGWEGDGDDRISLGKAADGMRDEEIDALFGSLW